MPDLDPHNPQAAPPIAATPPTSSIAPVGCDVRGALALLPVASVLVAAAPSLFPVLPGMRVGVAGTIVATAYLKDVHALSSDWEKTVGLPLGMVYSSPIASASHVIGTSVKAPVQLQAPFLVATPGIVSWNSHVSGP
jgi:hypothetical protein